MEREMAQKKKKHKRHNHNKPHGHIAYGL